MLEEVITQFIFQALVDVSTTSAIVTLKVLNNEG